MGAKQGASSGGQSAKQIERDLDRLIQTNQAMESIMTGGEISKQKEKELEKAQSYNRGIRITKDSRIVASKPTFGEVAKEFVGTAADIYTRIPTPGNLLVQAARRSIDQKETGIAKQKEMASPDINIARKRRKPSTLFGQAEAGRQMFQTKGQRTIT
jgi:hypothetical protein